MLSLIEARLDYGGGHSNPMYVVSVLSRLTFAKVAHEQPKSSLHGIELLKPLHLSSEYYVQ